MFSEYVAFLYPGVQSTCPEPPVPDRSRLNDRAASSSPLDKLVTKQPPAPELPPEVAKATTARYLEAFKLLTGESL